MTTRTQMNLANATNLFRYPMLSHAVTPKLCFSVFFPSKRHYEIPAWYGGAKAIACFDFWGVGKGEIKGNGVFGDDNKKNLVSQ
jgi:hypothetical protein